MTEHINFSNPKVSYYTYSDDIYVFITLSKLRPYKAKQ